MPDHLLAAAGRASGGPASSPLPPSLRHSAMGEVRSGDTSGIMSEAASSPHPACAHQAGWETPYTEHRAAARSDAGSHCHSSRGFGFAQAGGDAPCGSSFSGASQTNAHADPCEVSAATAPFASPHRAGPVSGATLLLADGAVSSSAGSDPNMCMACEDGTPSDPAGSLDDGPRDGMGAVAWLVGAVVAVLGVLAGYLALAIAGGWL